MKIDDRTWAVMNDRISWLKKLAKRREYEFGAKAEQYLFICYCSLRNLMDTKYAQIAVCNLNRQLDVSLTEKQLQDKIFTPVDEAKLIPKFNNSDIIRRLGISTLEEEELGIGINMKKRREGMERNKARKVRNKKIVVDYDAGMTEEELSEKFKLSVKQIKNILRPHKKWMKSRKEEDIVAWYLWGFNITEVAKLCECSRDLVYKVLNRHYNVEKKQSLPELGNISMEDDTTTQKFVDDVGDLYSLYKGKLEHSNVNEQIIALSTLQSSEENIFIQGDGGTGKTHLLNTYLKSLSTKERNSTLVVAPTGISASHINAKTIHNAFSLDCEVVPNNKSVEVSEMLKKINQIIVDEVNMVRIDIFSYICRVIQHIELTEHRHIRLIVMGDFGQIQPVAKPEDINKIREYYPSAVGVYAFDSEFWNAMKFKKILLTYVHRQSDLELVNKLREVKYGKISAVQWFNDNCDSEPDEDAVYICPTKKLVEHYNKQAVSRFRPNDFSEFRATCNGDISNEDLPCPQILRLAVGMRIMTVCNTKKFKNGSLGTITRINKKSVCVQLDEGKEITVYPKLFHLSNNVGYKQLPIKWAYALTANRCEGCTFSKVNIVPGYFSPNQLYVALSRCRSLENIHILGKLKVSDLWVDRRALSMTISQ